MKALQPRFDRIDKQIDIVKVNIENVHSELVGVKIEVMGIKAQLAQQEKTLLDVIKNVAEDYSLKEDTGKREERLLKLERLQKAS